jgi:hypothetical protein
MKRGAPLSCQTAMFEPQIAQNSVHSHNVSFCANFTDPRHSPKNKDWSHVTPRQSGNLQPYDLFGDIGTLCTALGWRTRISPAGELYRKLQARCNVWRRLTLHVVRRSAHGCYKCIDRDKECGRAEERCVAAESAVVYGFAELKKCVAHFMYRLRPPPRQQQLPEPETTVFGCKALCGPTQTHHRERIYCGER